MHSGTILPKKHMYIMLISLSVIIFMTSMEMMMRVKDVALFDIWYQNHNEVSREAAFSVYVTGLLSVYFQSIIAPVVFGIHTYFAYVKIRINKLFVFMWTVLLGGGLAMVIVSRQFDSIFYYIIIVFYMILIGTILSLIGVINQSKAQ